MTTTPNLQIDHIVASQAQKEVTANAAFDALDKAICQLTEVALSDADLTLTDDQVLGCMALSFTGTLTAQRTITVPAHAKMLFVRNDTDGGYGIVLTVDGGTALSIASGSAKLLYGDGTDLAVVAEAASAVPYDVGGSYVGAPGASMVLLRYPMPRAVRFSAGLSGSQGVANTAATAEASFSIAKNGTAFASMVFAASACVATFSCESDTDFAAGDVLTVMAPTTADDTLADIGFSLAGIRL
ncbi:MAG: hypothetical protein PHS57_02975 [Alphaproteobacteria bacterium]|nr:hypothetical protein [Alphaproteobacteria bacterium]